jgi:NADH-quinone oxidoreductase subunit E
MSAFAPQNREKAREIVARYPFARSAVLPLLHLAQEQDGWVSPDAIEEVAALVGLEPAQVLGTCSFYTMYKRDGQKHLVVSVCTNVSCLVNGGPELHERLSEHYADADDVMVEEVECLAACDTAPVFQVNYEFHGNATSESATATIDEYRSGARAARGVSGGKPS